MKWPGALLFPSGWNAIPSQITLQHFVRFPLQFTSTHPYSCLAQGHSTFTWPSLKLEPLVLKFSAVPTFLFILIKILGSILVSGQLPTYPSPNSTTVNWQQVKVNVGLGEGLVGSRPDTPRLNKDRLEPESVREELVLAYFFVGIIGLRALRLGITKRINEHWAVRFRQVFGWGRSLPS